MSGRVRGSRLSAAVYDPVMWISERRGMAERRARVVALARGETLELGAGTGLNLPHYPPAVSRLALTEPEPNMARQLRRRLDREQVAAKTEVVEAVAEELPFPDASFDTVVSTLVLCTVGDPARAVAEIARVLRPGGELLFCEHVRSDSPRLARWQDRLRRPWEVLADGCQCNRPTVDTIAASGLEVSARRERWRGVPPLVRPLAVGRATVPG